MLGPFVTVSRRTPPNFTLPFTRGRYCRTPPAHRCQQRRHQQRQRVTEGPLWPHRMGPKRESSNLPTWLSGSLSCSAVNLAGWLVRQGVGSSTTPAGMSSQVSACYEIKFSGRDRPACLQNALFQTF